MWFKVKMPTMLSIFAIILCATATNDLEFNSSLDNFSKNIFNEIFESKGQQSIIFSPFSIQSCLTMARMGAGGETATEMDEGLGFTGQSDESVATNYHSLLAKYEESNILQIANKVYLNKDYELQDKYSELVSQKFFSQAENVDFGQGEKTAQAINSWVESKTNNAIKNIVDPASLTSDTALFLLSAIHFKGNWKNPFAAEHTEEEDFYTDDSNTVKVQMMYQQSRLKHGKIPELDATAVRMLYKDSDLSMVIILPKSRSGLDAMLEKLNHVSLQSVSGKIDSLGGVTLRLPKFKTEFEIELTPTLKKMGMNKMFGHADFGKMLKTSEPLYVSQVVHTAFIDVNEVGTEAAATTLLGLKARARPFPFMANHPFYYVIMNEDSVPLFQGTFIGL